MDVTEFINKINTILQSESKDNTYYAKIILPNSYYVNSMIGVYTDAKILQELIPNSIITSLDSQILSTNRSTLNIFIEHIDEQFFNTAKTNIFLINHDILFDKIESMKKLTNKDWILCKSREAYKILNNSGLIANIIKIGFTSLNKCSFNNTIIKDYKKILHIAGKSWMKNTLLVVKTFVENNDIGELTVICREFGMKQGYYTATIWGGIERQEWNDIINLVKNNEKLKSRIRIFSYAEEVKKADGNILDIDPMDYVLSAYGINLCPSEIEGWGHYLHEGLANGNIVVTTDRSPMNEYIKNSINGFLISTYKGNPEKYGTYGHFKCVKAKFKTNDLANVIRNIRSESKFKLDEISKNAKESFIKNDKRFKERFKKFLSVLPQH